MWKAIALGASLSVLAAPVMAETVRPKPRPVLASASAVMAAPTPAPDAGTQAEAMPAVVPAQTAALPPRPVSRPIGPPAPQAKAEPVVVPRDPNKGAVTNLPLPRYVSLKTGEGNARRGPGLSHRIDWVFTLAGMPLKITAEHEHWRRVEDAEGLGGWVHYSLLSGVRSVMVAKDMANFYSRPDTGAQVAFQAEANVVGRVNECGSGWCRVSVGGERGWVQVQDLWGVSADEVIE